MSTLEDKILGNKLHNYCSSSEGEDSGNEENSGEDSGATALPSKGRNSVATSACEPSKWDGVSTNTGPKGVLKDWQRFKQLETEKRKEQDAERLSLMKKLSLTCRSTLDDEKDKNNLDNDFGELMSDEFLEQFRKQRMHEMLSKSSLLPRFGVVHELLNGEQFLAAVDDEDKNVTVIVHIYEDKVPGCKTMNSCLSELCQEYVQVKFCKLMSTAAGMSNQFKSDGVPALLVYKGGQVVGNFVRVTDELGDEFYVGDVENFLIEHGMIVDRSCVPNIISGPKANDDDSDVSLE